MYAVKASWSGQTFALAKFNDSQGKKSRTRRTKEERKAMVESFINKYRSSNNGNFPSLNLTHKEVGGSFYTVREIVRDIIQENKVLGPANVPFEENKIDFCSEQHVSDPLLTEPQSNLSLSSAFAHAVDHKQNEIIFLSNEDQSICGEPIKNSGGKPSNRCYEMVESKDLQPIKSHSVDIYISQFVHKAPNDKQCNSYNARFINGNSVDGECKEEEATKPSELEEIRIQEHELKCSEGQSLDYEAGRKIVTSDVPTSSIVDNKVVSGNVLFDSISETKLDMNVKATKSSELGELRTQEQESKYSEDYVSESLDDGTGKESLSSDAPASFIANSKMVSETVISDIVSDTEVDMNMKAAKPSKLGEIRTQESGESLDDGTGKQNFCTDVPTSSIMYGKMVSETVISDIISETKADMDMEASSDHSKKMEGSNVSVLTQDQPSVSTTMSSVGSSESSGKATKETAEASATNPFWDVIKAFVNAFVKFWVE